MELKLTDQEPLQPLSGGVSEEGYPAHPAIHSVLDPAIDLQAVSVGRAEESILHEIDLSVRERDCFGIVGPSGGGKTTLLRVILGLISPASGSVRLFGMRPGGRLRKQLPVGFLPQFAPIPEETPATVWDYVCMGARSAGGWFYPLRRENAMYAENLLAALHLDHRMKQPVGRLSFGQQQRVRIARALAALPKLLVMDEPFLSLDAQGRELVGRLLADLQRRVQVTVLLAAQDGKPLASICKRMACVNRSLIWVAGRRQFHDGIWADPCHYLPSRDGERRDESSDLPPRSFDRSRALPSSHVIQFWR